MCVPRRVAARCTTMNVCLQTVRTLAVLMAPFLPHSAEKCRTRLKLAEDQMMWSRATEELEAGHQLGEPETLFRKLDAGELFADGQQRKPKSKKTNSLNFSQGEQEGFRA